MNALSGAAIFVVQTLVSLYLAIVLLRFVLQLVKADFYNPLSQFAVRATQPLLAAAPGGPQHRRPGYLVAAAVGPDPGAADGLRADAHLRHLR